MRSLFACLCGFILVAAHAPAQSPTGGVVHSLRQGATPEETSRWIESTVTQAAQSGQKSVTIPPGTYLLAPLHKMSHLRWEGLQDLAVEATGVDFVLTEPTLGGLDFANCHGVTLHGLRLRHDPVPFTQGRLETISADRKTVHIRIDRGYPANLDDKGRFYAKGRLWFYIFEGASRRWRPQTHDTPVQQLTKLGEGFFEMQLNDELYPAAQAGDGVAFRGKSGTDIHFIKCGGMRLEDVEIKNGGGFCMHEQEGAGGNFYNYRVTYGPPPSPDAPQPVIACNADAFHSSNVRKGPTLEKCSFEGMPDDGVPIHGVYARLVDVNGAKAVANRLMEGRPGDHIRILDANARIIAETKLVSYAAQPGFKPPEKFDERLVGPFFAIELAAPIPPNAFLISNVDACGSGFLVKGCTIRNHRARGILIKSGDGVIEDNLIEGSTKGGIVLAPEYRWREACYSWNVIIRNNVLRNIGTGWQPTEPMAGAISIGAFENGGYAETIGHRHIVVESNTIEDTAAPNLVISSASDVSVVHNQFIRPRPAGTGRQAQIENGDRLIVIADSEKLDVVDNTVSLPTTNLSSPWIESKNVKSSEMAEPVLKK